MLRANKEDIAYDVRQGFLPYSAAQGMSKQVGTNQINFCYALFRLRGFCATRRLGALKSVRMIQV